MESSTVHSPNVLISTHLRQNGVFDLPSDFVLDFLQRVQVTEHGVEVLGGFAEIGLDFHAVDDFLPSPGDIGVPRVFMLQQLIPANSQLMIKLNYHKLYIVIDPVAAFY